MDTRVEPHRPGASASRVVATILMAGFMLLSATAQAADAPRPNLPPPDERTPKLIGIQFIGQQVADLDRSIAFYKALGFEQDPAASPQWREGDEIFQQLVATPGLRTRMAKMFTLNTASGQRFVVYLRELQGIERGSHAGHPAWEPGATGFGLVVADAPALWASLKAAGMLNARNPKGELVAPPDALNELQGFITDPDGLDIDIVQARPAADGRAALPPGLNNVSLVIKDAFKARAFYGGTLGGEISGTPSKWLAGEYRDAITGSSGSESRVFMARFPESLAPIHLITYQLVEYSKPVLKPLPRRITDSGVSYVGIEVQNLKAWVQRTLAGGGKVISDRPLVTTSNGTREVMVQDPDVGGFVLLFEQP